MGPTVLRVDYHKDVGPRVQHNRKDLQSQSSNRTHCSSNESLDLVSFSYLIPNCLLSHLTKVRTRTRQDL